MKLLPEFQPSTEDPQGPGAAGNVFYPSQAAYETHHWFSLTSMIFGGLGAAVGSVAGSSVGKGDKPVFTVIGSVAGAIFGIYMGNQTPPA